MKTIKETNQILVLTGAGISAESGIRTFRASDGLWEEHRVEDVASPEGFAADPILVWKFYKERYKQALNVKPNPAHYALKTLEEALGNNFWLVTQNVDGLHERAGNKNLIEMHGSLNTCFCTSCSKRFHTCEIDLEASLPPCPSCGKMLRPDIVWFGEIPYELDKIQELLQQTNLLIVIGTSGNVYPAAGFVMTARYLGARTMAINLDKPENQDFFDEFHQGKAGEILPRLVDEWLK